MSSILDALEKAEEERLRGGSSGLQPVSRKQKARRVPVSVIASGTVVLLLVNLLVWWFYFRAEPESEPPVVADVNASPETGASTATVTAMDDRNARVPAPALSLHEHLKRSTAPSARPLSEAAQVKRKPMPVPAPAPAPAPVPAPVTTAPETAAEAHSLPFAGVPAAPAEAVRASAAVASVAPVQDGGVPEAAAETLAPVLMVEPPSVQEEEPIPLVWELPQSLREKVLQLKSTIHVFNEIPAQRFVIINMRRYAEGDTLPPDGFVLSRIDQDGVVIDYGEGKVRLPRR